MAQNTNPIVRLCIDYNDVWLPLQEATLVAQVLIKAGACSKAYSAEFISDPCSVRIESDPKTAPVDGREYRHEDCEAYISARSAARELDKLAPFPTIDQWAKDNKIEKRK